MPKWTLPTLAMLAWLPQEVSKELINHLSHKVSYASMIIDPIIRVFSTNEVKSHLNM